MALQLLSADSAGLGPAPPSKGLGEQVLHSQARSQSSSPELGPRFQSGGCCLCPHHHFPTARPIPTAWDTPRVWKAKTTCPEGQW